MYIIIVHGETFKTSISYSTLYVVSRLLDTYIQDIHVALLCAKLDSGSVCAVSYLTFQGLVRL